MPQEVAHGRKFTNRAVELLCLAGEFLAVEARPLKSS